MENLIQFCSLQGCKAILVYWGITILIFHNIYFSVIGKEIGCHGKQASFLKLSIPYANNKSGRFALQKKLHPSEAVQRDSMMGWLRTFGLA